jgi:excisionase family DNA binding protein
MATRLVEQVEDEYMTPQEVMALCNVNKRYIQRIADEGRIPVFKMGRLLRFKRSDVEAYIEAQTRPAKKQGS